VTHKIVVAALLLLVLLGGAAFVRYSADQQAREAHSRKTGLLLPQNAAVLETSHYRIHYTGTAQQAELVGNTVEKLYAAYTSVFPQTAAPAADKLILVLYKDRIEFKHNNRSSPWAEAYYLKPACYAYFDAEAANPYHWMLHEATHQLSRQFSGFRRNRWIDEGLASYFSTSQLDGSGMRLGTTDANAYPIWWVGHYRDKGEFIPIEALLTGQGGPDVNQKFNLYYVDAWSLTHFLFHHENGKYAPAYKQFLAKGATLDDFVSVIGPLEQIQAEWRRTRGM
jgi:hypothetical protein